MGEPPAERRRGCERPRQGQRRHLGSCTAVPRKRWHTQGRKATSPFTSSLRCPRHGDGPTNRMSEERPGSHAGRHGQTRGQTRGPNAARRSHHGLAAPENEACSAAKDSRVSGPAGMHLQSSDHGTRPSNEARRPAVPCISGTGWDTGAGPAGPPPPRYLREASGPRPGQGCPLTRWPEVPGEPQRHMV